ncbi:MAG TPA: hypothetical protein EYM84_05295, partial [Flavobacteriales bacterium]|nr:hypothetical protein [Flavobacteriales bacterium]
MNTETTRNMKTLYFTLISIFLLIKVGYGQTLVQTKSSFGNEGCGTIATQHQINYLNKTKVQRQNYNVHTFAKTINSQVPIQCHVVRTDLGAGGLTPTAISVAINTMNSYYANVNIEFYQINPINYIDNSNYYNFEYSQEADVCDSNDVPNVINIYFFKTVTLFGSPIGGYSYYPPSADRIIMTNSCTMSGNTLTHEMGHYFSLYHTHGKSNYTRTDELVDGSNCTVAGDDICDTPADPNLTYLVDGLSCLYIGTETDDNGELYSPDPTNIMSYSQKHCRTTLSAGQYNRVAYSLEFDRNYLGVGTCPAFTNAPYQESFEDGLGDWIQDADDDMDWINQTGQTPTAGTGPSSAVDGQRYMYIESSYPNHPYKTAGLISPCISLGFDSEIRFQYHMFGSNTGGLSVDVSTDYGLTWMQLWGIAGDQGNIWHTAVIDLADFANDVIKLKIQGITGADDKSDIAIDNISILNLPPYCGSSGYFSNWFWIEAIEIGNINNVSGIDGGYGDYTSLSATITDGMQISLTPGYFAGPPSQGLFWNVWIDWNHDHDFDDAGELVIKPLPFPGTINRKFNIPAGALPGETRMRIQAKLGYWAPSTCGTFFGGEVEDYTVFFGSPKLAGGNVKEPVKELDHTLSTIPNPKAADYGQTLAVNTFPNPSKGLLQLEVLGGAEEGFAYKVLNLTGAIVHEGDGIYGTAARIDLSEQPKG